MTRKQAAEPQVCFIFYLSKRNHCSELLEYSFLSYILIKNIWQRKTYDYTDMQELP